MPATLTTEFSQTGGLETTFTRARPLPRLTPLPKPQTTESDISKSSTIPDQQNQDVHVSTPLRSFEVVVVGAGPAGLTLTLLLARFGLSESSLLCIDNKPNQVRVGNADGVNARTLEILGQLGLEADIRKYGCPFGETTVWTRSSETGDLQRTMKMPFHMADARYEELITIHQGHIERILREDLNRYSKSGVQYGANLLDMKIDEAADADFPVVVTFERNGVKETVRTKYLVGADGAKSAVRSFMGVPLEGDMTDELWGVIDIVVDTDFPDIRRHCSFSNNDKEGNEVSGSRAGFTVPRERLSTGEYLTRLYIDMSVKEEAPKDPSAPTANGDSRTDTSTAATQREKTREKRNNITKELILERAANLYHPFRFKVKEGTEVPWWAAFAIGQRLATSFSLKDLIGHPRVFIVGDACHSHSPRQGQGMNVSIQDSHNLAWKLAYTLFGLDKSEGWELLNSYEAERLPNARNLIYFDKRWNQQGTTRQERLAEMKHFATSCGIEYGEGLLVHREKDPEGEEGQIGERYLNGRLRTGRRFLNVEVNRFASGNKRDIHDELRGEGQFSIVVFANDDFGKSSSTSAKIAEEICTHIVKSFPTGLVQPLIIYPNLVPEFEWTDLPNCIKVDAEMALFSASSEVYATYGLKTSQGALVVVRPDGFVGLKTSLEDTKLVQSFLERFLRSNVSLSLNGISKDHV